MKNEKGFLLKFYDGNSREYFLDELIESIYLSKSLIKEIALYI